MANHKSAVKRARQNDKRRRRNRANRTRLRGQIKRFRTAIEKGEATAAEGLLAPTLSLIDRSAAKGILPDNAAARRKARLTRMLHGLASTKT